MNTEIPCKGFRWIGQSFKCCDSCGQPYWEHTYNERLKSTAGPFDEYEDSWEYVLITDKQKTNVKARWS